MPLLEADRSLPELPITPHHLVIEEEWGELWRARHDKHGEVLLALYSGPSGESAFFDSLVHLRQWRALAPRTTTLLPILDIHDSEAIPLLVLEDPGGPPLSDYCRIHAASFTAHNQAGWGREVAAIVVSLHQKGILPVGLSPHLLFHRPRSSGSAWCVAPCAPGHPDVYSFLSGGEMLPRGYTPGGESWSAGLDTWVLAWIWMWLRGEKPGQPLSEEFSSPMDREVRRILSRCLVRDAGGSYPNPETLLENLEALLSWSGDKS